MHTHSKHYSLSVVILVCFPFLVSFYLPAGDLDLQSFDGGDDYERLSKVNFLNQGKLWKWAGGSRSQILKEKNNWKIVTKLSYTSTDILG